MTKFSEKAMWDIKSFNFTCWNAENLNTEAIKRQIDEMVSRCEINTVNFAFGALQDHTYSTDIDCKGPHIIKDSILTEAISYAKGKGLKVILKPMINVRDGYWRAFIRFFDEDVPCEPKWSQWFKSNTEYLLHYADLCEKNDVDMMIIGCELVGTDHRAEEWKQVVAKLRERFSGLLTYNCDKYQEHNVAWWDVLDVISSSGYYPINDWENQIKRIESVVKKFQKPFFFSEVGCPSTKAAAMVPNDWTAIDKGTVSLEEQDNFFKTMFEACENLHWHYGYSIWDWSAHHNQESYDANNGGYSVIDKPAHNTIKACFSK